eukprot:456521-Amphidinium_carterae.1
MRLSAWHPDVDFELSPASKPDSTKPSPLIWEGGHCHLCLEKQRISDTPKATHKPKTGPLPPFPLHRKYTPQKHPTC